MENTPTNNGFSPANPTAGNMQNNVPPAQPQYNQPYNQQPNGYTAPQGTPYQVPQYTPESSQAYPRTPYGGYTANNVQQTPSVIYNNTRTGNAPQYHYGNPMGAMMDNNYYLEQQEKIRKRRLKEKEIRKTGNIAGLSLIFTLFVALAFSAILLIPSFSELYYSGVGGQSFFSIFHSILVVGGVFFVLRQYLKKNIDRKTLKPKYTVKINYGMPKNPAKTALLVFISVGGCLLANYLSSFILAFLQILGIESTYSSLQEPSGALEIIMMFIATALIPPLVEEYSMRGVTMSFLSKHGKTFAILASAYMFGIFHGTVAQIPFAFMCGLFFGYAVFASGSLWTAVIIHLINNSLSCVSSIIIKEFDESAGNIFFYISTSVFIILGFICLGIYIKNYKQADIKCFKPEDDDLPLKTKFAKFLSSPAMIMATILYFVQALTTLKFTGFAS